MTVTAVVVSHANERGLRTMLDNLLRQTQPPDEIIVLCSDTDAERVSYDYKSAGFILCEDRKDWGHEKRSEGLARARSEWIGFFNDDDSYVDSYLERMLARAEAENADVVYCAWNEQPHCDFKGWHSTSGNFLCRTELGQRVGWAGRHYEADAAFIDELVAAGAKVVRVDEILYHHNVQ